MRGTPLERELARSRSRMARLRRRAEREGMPSDSPQAVALEELGHTLEELSAALEQLEVSNEELAEARRAAEQHALRFRELFQSVPDAYLVTDARGVIREANRAAEVKLGRAARYLAGKPLLVYVAAEHQEAFQKHIVALGRTPRTRIGEWEPRFAPRGAEPFWAAVTAEAAREPGGAVAEIRWLLRDVTERRRIEEALQASEARMRLMADALPVLISYVDRDERYRFNSAAYEDWFGRPPEQLRGKPVREVLGDDAYDRVRAYIAQALAGQPVRFDGELPYAGAGVRHVSISYAPHRDETGEVLGFYALVSDVSELKAAERQARDAEERMRVVVDSALDGIVAIDERGVIESVNPAVGALFGYAPEELLGRNAELLMPPDMLAGHRGPRPGREVVGRRKDGTQFPLQVLVAEARHRGRPIFVGVLHDLSEQRRMQEELRAAAAATALAEDRERRRLAQDLHDDLGQLLSLAGIKLGALRDDLAGSGAEAEIRQIEKLVAEAHGHAESLTFQLSPPILHDQGLVPAAEWLGEDLGRSYQLRVEVEHDGRGYPLDEAARVALFRALRELLINVARHAGAREAYVWISRAGEHVRVEVRDHGLGFNSADAGRGFGLVSVRERLRHLGGDLEIHSAPGEGTRVVAEAPVGRKEPA